MYIGTRPLKLAYGVDGIDIFRAFMDHWVEGGDAGRRELEDFFGAFAEPVETHIGIVRFRERGRNVPIATADGPLHPSRPLGSPRGVKSSRAHEIRAGTAGGEVLTLHGASDHDLNPISQEELGKVLASGDEGRGGNRGLHHLRLAVPQGAGRVRCVRAGVRGRRGGGAHLVAGADGRPGRPTGYVIERHLEQGGARPGIFVDAHNCLAPGTGGVSFGTPKARALATRLAAVGTKALKGRRPGLRAGAASAPRPTGSRGFGPMGVQAIVVEAGGQRMAWVLLDGNKRRARAAETVRDSLLGLVDECEILTTDNHVVNVMVGGFNPSAGRRASRTWSKSPSRP